MIEPRYFVLEPYAKPPVGHASRQAMLAYADEIMDDDPELADDLARWARNCYLWEGSTTDRRPPPCEYGVEEQTLFAEGQCVLEKAALCAPPLTMPAWATIDPLLTVFVLKPRGSSAHARAARETMRCYAEHIEASDPDQAKRLREWVAREERQKTKPTDCYWWALGYNAAEHGEPMRPPHYITMKERRQLWIEGWRYANSDMEREAWDDGAVHDRGRRNDNDD